MPAQNSEKSALNVAAAKLRESSLKAAAGAFLGSEDDVLARMNVSRATLKQAARLLEREGLVKVKRGVGGGYYSARPTESTLKSVVNAYLDTINVDMEDIVSVTTILWLEVVRRASQSSSSELIEALRGLIEDVDRLTEDASFKQVDEIEQAGRRAIFALVDCRYIELIMRINQAFGSHHPAPTATHDGTTGHRDFVAAWRKAKTLELQAIAERDTALAEVAAHNCRRIWNLRVTTGAGPHRQLGTK
jgi:GntR family transcriptional regulator, transcriptional repressor for pyruvate dehydrogenase complex